MKSLYGIWNIRGRERNEVMKGIELSEKNVRLHVSARDWEEAVRIGGRILVENGTAKESYVEGMLSYQRDSPFRIQEQRMVLWASGFL